ncbi:MAG: hypothetical protein M3081_10585, partial [Gemmatimonadota bacterium]|nr:hypothetical protein [Gemmatimonadota bacterium]
MNVLLPSRFVERFDRLLLGIEPEDAVREQRIAHRVDVAIEPAHPWVDPLTDDQQRWLRARIDSGIPLSDLWPRASRHPSNRFVVTYEPGWSSGRTPHIDIRVMDTSERIVPRRLRVPLVSLGAAGSSDDLVVLDALPVGQRSRFPAFYPGATYDVSDRVSGLRGRVVVSNGALPPKRVPVRWARIEARLVTRGVPAGDPIAWAHGDQHGEFLLVLPPEAIAAAMVELPKTLTLEITAHGRRGLPAVLPPLLVQRADPFWDIPLEQIGHPGIAPEDDLVALG